MIDLQQTMVVGLGTAGLQFIETLKQRIDVQFGQQLPAVKLVALTVPQVAAEAVGGAATRTSQILGPTELFELPLNDVIHNPEEACSRYTWLSAEVTELGREWAHTRAAARLAMHLMVDSLRQNLSFYINDLGSIPSIDAMRKLGFNIAGDTYSFNLILVASLGDVTGSALLLDMAYLLESIISSGGQRANSTAILFMPEHGTELSEAVAYATLKELSHAMARQGYTTHLPGLPEQCIEAPFNHGLFLIDANNEKNIFVPTQERVRMAAEWVMRAYFSSLHPDISNFITSHNDLEMLDGQLTVFGSLGLSAYDYPVQDLIDYCTCQLSNELLMEEVLATELFGKVATRLEDFLTEQNLHPDNLKDIRLSVVNGNNLETNDPFIQSLSNTIRSARHLGAILPTVLNSISRRLPDVQAEFHRNSAKVSASYAEELNKEVAEILRLWPSGGLSAASQFLQQCVYKFEGYAHRLERADTAKQANNEHLLLKLKNALVSVTKALAAYPPIQVMITSLVGLLALVVLFWIWIWGARETLGAPLALVLNIIIGAVAAGGALLANYRMDKHLGEMVDQLLNLIMDYYKAEVGRLLNTEERDLYPVLVKQTREQLQRLTALAGSLQEMAVAFRQRSSQFTLCGPIGFATQTSLLDDNLVQTLYEGQLTGGLQAKVQPLMQAVGQLDTWLVRRQVDIQMGIFRFGQAVFKELKSWRAEELLAQRIEKEAQTQRSSVDLRKQQVMADLVNRAAPFLLFKPFQMSQGAQAPIKTFFGAEQADGQFQNVVRHITPVGVLYQATNDPHNLFVTSLRQGLPVFGLARYEELRRHYLHFVKETELPLHLDDECGLTYDLARENDPDRRRVIDPATAFVVGQAIGLIRPNSEGVYSVYLPDGKVETPLSMHKISSVIMLGADVSLYCRLREMIDDVVAQKQGSATASVFEEYLEKLDYANWERKRMDAFIQMLRA